MSLKTKRPINEDITWVKIGDKVRFVKAGTPVGQKWLGENDAWICVGALGTVVKLSTGYPRHRCPDHQKEPDCICGGPECSDEPGWVKAHAAWATVAYETDIPGRTIKRAIERDDEGKDWERMKSQ